MKETQALQRGPQAMSISNQRLDEKLQRLLPLPLDRGETGGSVADLCPSGIALPR